jgi:hypothetical protein
MSGGGFKDCRTGRWKKFVEKYDLFRWNTTTQRVVEKREAKETLLVLKWVNEWVVVSECVSAFIANSRTNTFV